MFSLDKHLGEEDTHSESLFVKVLESLGSMSSRTSSLGFVLEARKGRDFITYT